MVTRELGCVSDQRIAEFKLICGYFCHHFERSVVQTFLACMIRSSSILKWNQCLTGFLKQRRSDFDSFSFLYSSFVSTKSILITPRWFLILDFPLSSYPNIVQTTIVLYTPNWTVDRKFPSDSFCSATLYLNYLNICKINRRSHNDVKKTFVTRD